MPHVSLTDITEYVERHISDFHARRLGCLDKLKMTEVLKRKNPYLFRAKNVLTTEEIIRGIVDAHISSNEETLFGAWLEGLAIFVAQKAYGGYKSGITGIDLEFNLKDVRYIVAIKSGPNWGNSGQIAKMKSDFSAAKKTLRTSNSGLQVTAVNGCCYGRDSRPDKGDYFKYCGQRFWRFISDDIMLYTRIIEPLGHRAKEKNDAFMTAYAQRINQFTREFSQDFCMENGAIAWERLVDINASEKPTFQCKPYNFISGHTS
ncbi:MAG: hypothetical protein LBU76_00885 [Azoarcus sp.]|jgi:hypothetical protein|nr:hypothetical protein [Azoarcus sp.]